MSSHFWQVYIKLLHLLLKHNQLWPPPYSEGDENSCNSARKGGRERRRRYVEVMECGWSLILSLEMKQLVFLRRE